MDKLSLNPYINFQGKAREAMEFYQKIFGGKLELSTFGENGAPKPAQSGDRIMHAQLDTDEIRLMASDGSPQYPPTVGDNFAIALSGTDAARLIKIFNELAEGGNVKFPLAESQWGASFGWLTDKFQVSWMVNINKA